MKRIIIIAAAFAALTACSKTETETVNVTEPSGSTSFEKGQTLTLIVSTPGQTKVTSALVASTGDVTFKWEATDSIKVTVNESPAIFKVSELIEGGVSAKFTGVMPEGGTTFNVQYPYTTPTLTEQTYSSAEALPHDKMLFTATDCKISEGSFTLEAQYSALRLNLYGSKPIGKIVVSDGGESPTTYTLTCGDPGTGITLGATADEATPFFIVVPAVTYKFFSAEIFDNSTTPASICKFEPTNAQKFTTGKVLNMPAKEVKASPSIPEGALSGVFTVGAGDDGVAGTDDDVKVRFSKGNLWTNTEASPQTWSFEENQYDLQSGYSVSHVSHFFWETTGNYGSGFKCVTITGSSDDRVDWGVPYCEANGLPEGTWRTLTSAEWQYLFGSNDKRQGLYAYGVTVAGKTNCVVLYPDGFKGTKVSNGDTSSYATEEGWSSAAASGVVCLPAAGFRAIGNFVSNVGDYGYYWSSTVLDEYNAYSLLFSSLQVFTGNDNSRACGSSVRLVSAAQ